MARLFVRGVSERCGKRELGEIFSKYGEVVGVQTGQAGFAFVDMESDKEAQDAIDALHGVELEGDRITVERARGEGKGPFSSPHGDSRGDFRCFNCNLQGHLARDCTEKPRNPLYVDTRGTKITDIGEGRGSRFHPYDRPPPQSRGRERGYQDRMPPPRGYYEGERPPRYEMHFYEFHGERRGNMEQYPPRQAPDGYKNIPIRSPDRGGSHYLSDRRGPPDFPSDPSRSRQPYFDRGRMERDRGQDGVHYQRRSPEPRPEYLFRGERDMRPLQDQPFRSRSPMRTRAPVDHYRMREPMPKDRRSPPFYPPEGNGERFRDHEFGRPHNRTPERYRGRSPGRYKPIRNSEGYGQTGRPRSPRFSGPVDGMGKL